MSELVPKLRFKQADGDAFPGWNMMLLSDIVEVARGGSPRPIEEFVTKEDNGVPWIKIGDIRVGQKYITNTEEKIKPEGIKKSREIYPGDFVLSNSMSFGRPYISKIYGCIHDGWLVLRNSKGLVTSEYLYELLSSDDVKRKFLAAAAGSAVKNLKSETVRNVLVGVPHIEEQQKIALFLSVVDEKIRLLERRLELFQTYKRGVMQKLFSQEVRFKRADGSSFPDWKEKTLGDIAEIVGGGTPDTSVSEFWNGDVPWFTPTEIKKKYLFESQRMITKAGVEKSSAKLLPKGTLLLSTRATVGEIGISLQECTTNQGFQSLVIKKCHSNEFWYYWVLNNKKEFLRRASGSTFAEISKTSMQTISVMSPRLEEQQKIATFLSALDTKLDAVSTQISQVQRFKKGLLQQMFV